MHFKIDWASLIVGSFCCVLLCILGQFSKYKPLVMGANIWRGDLTEGFLHLPVRGAYIFGGAYTWRSLFLEFYGNFSLLCNTKFGF